MDLFFSDKVKKLNERLDCRLFVVGGYVRDLLKGGEPPADVDIAAAIDAQAVASAAEQTGFKILCFYPRTGTVAFTDGNSRYEFTRFRSDVYSGGKHMPDEVSYTDDLDKDARRRDFTCNAVYARVCDGSIVDPLGGVFDIERGILDTVTDAEKVFSADGLRLMRLARFSGELGFEPTQAVIDAARRNRFKIVDISKERIKEELKKILEADRKPPYNVRGGHYGALKVLERTGVLDVLLPELSEGRGMSQRADFHKYDVLEHTLKTVYYAPPNLRLAALLHDVGKPAAMKRFGRYSGHENIGEEISKEKLSELKFDARTIRKTSFLVAAHMFDLECDESELKVREFIAENYADVPDLLSLKQADYRAGLDADDVCPTVARWTEIISGMKEEGAPFSAKDLKITAKDLIKIGYRSADIGKELKVLLKLAVRGELKNDEKTLFERAAADFRYR